MTAAPPWWWYHYRETPKRHGGLWKCCTPSPLHLLGKESTVPLLFLLNLLLVDHVLAFSFYTSTAGSSHRAYQGLLRAPELAWGAFTTPARRCLWPCFHLNIHNTLSPHHYFGAWRQFPFCWSKVMGFITVCTSTDIDLEVRKIIFVYGWEVLFSL